MNTTESSTTDGSSDRDSENDDDYDENIDILTPLMLLFPVASAIVSFLDPQSTLRLLNVSAQMRRQLVSVHFRHFRKLMVMKDPDYQQKIAPWSMLPYSGSHVDDEEWVSRTSKFVPGNAFFLRFGDFAFEQLVVGKLLEVPIDLHPTADQRLFETLGVTRVITSLHLDGTNVSGSGLFGSLYIPPNGYPERVSPGLLSFLSCHLKELSLRNCPLVEHADVCAFMLMPPTYDVAMKKLRRLWVWNCGEAPAVGPFHNKLGYGSRGKIARDADHVLTIRVLKVLFPIGVPFEHHVSVSLPLTIPYSLPYKTRTRMLAPLQQRLLDQFKVGWFSPQHMFAKAGTALLNGANKLLVPGPWGGVLSSMHESLMLYSVCKNRKVMLDWGMCMNGDKCHGWTAEQFKQISQVHVRSGRTMKMGNMLGAGAKDHGGSSSWWSHNNGPVPRVPQELLPQNLPVHLARVPQQEDSGDIEGPNLKEKPKYVSLQGMIDAPDLLNPLHRDTILLFGMQGAGIHTHSAAGMFQRKDCGGQACANCGLWEGQHSVITLPTGRTYLDLGRFYPAGELCELCVIQQTCTVCGNFYCSNCVKPPIGFDKPDVIPNPFQHEPPNEEFLIKTCNVHSVHCAPCLSVVQTACRSCGQFLCMDCYHTGDLDVLFEQCRECECWWCADCMYEGGLDVCDGRRCSDGGGMYKKDGREQGCCDACMKGMCQGCNKIYCAFDYQDMRKEFNAKYGIQMPPENAKISCVDCFESAIRQAGDEDERVDIWMRMGIDVLAREAEENVRVVQAYVDAEEEDELDDEDGEEDEDMDMDRESVLKNNEAPKEAGPLSSTAVAFDPFNNGAPLMLPNLVPLPSGQPPKFDQTSNTESELHQAITHLTKLLARHPPSESTWATVMHLMQLQGELVPLPASPKPVKDSEPNFRELSVSGNTEEIKPTRIVSMETRARQGQDSSHDISVPSETKINRGHAPFNATASTFARLPCLPEIAFGEAQTSSDYTTPVSIHQDEFGDEFEASSAVFLSPKSDLEGYAEDSSDDDVEVELDAAKPVVLKGKRKVVSGKSSWRKERLRKKVKVPVK